MCGQYNGRVPGPVYPEHTSVNRRCYFFYDKHHTPANNDDAQWLPGLSQAEEFAVFELADRHDLSAHNGDLFGLRMHEGAALDLGMLGEKVASFPFARGETPWHGFPSWPLAKGGGPSGRKYLAPRQVLKKMEAVNLINAKQRRRLEAGKHI
jgi:hypothetical protein